MTENNHTLEPMFQFDFNQLATFENGRTPVLLTEDQYRRAQSCVNALEGLNDYALAGGWSFRGIEAYAKGLEKQRDELLAALERCRFALEPYDDIKPRDWKSDRLNLRDAHQVAVAAIANMKGEQ